MDLKMLYNAIINNNVKIINSLVKNGVDINNPKQEPPFLHIPNIKPKIMKLLLEFNADPNIRSKEGKTPLMIHTKRKIIKHLIKYNADINAEDNNGNTVLMIHEDPKIIKLLIKHNVDVNNINKNGKTALMDKKIKYDKLKLLLDNGADPTINDKDDKLASDNYIDEYKKYKLLKKYEKKINKK